MGFHSETQVLSGGVGDGASSLAPDPTTSFIAPAPHAEAPKSPLSCGYAEQGNRQVEGTAPGFHV